MTLLLSFKSFDINSQQILICPHTLKAVILRHVLCACFCIRVKSKRARDNENVTHYVFRLFLFFFFLLIVVWLVPSRELPMRSLICQQCVSFSSWANLNFFFFIFFVSITFVTSRRSY